MRSLSRNLLFRQQVCKLCLIYTACTLTGTDYRGPSSRLYLKLFRTVLIPMPTLHGGTRAAFPSTVLTFVTFLKLVICPPTRSVDSASENVRD